MTSSLKLLLIEDNKGRWAKVYRPVRVDNGAPMVPSAVALFAKSIYNWTDRKWFKFPPDNRTLDAPFDELHLEKLIDPQPLHWSTDPINSSIIAYHKPDEFYCGIRLTERAINERSQALQDNQGT